MDKALAELRAKWMAAQSIDYLQELLTAETEDGKFKILGQLLSYELEKLKNSRASNSRPLPIPQSASRYR
jgi:hypothetical protein